MKTKIISFPKIADPRGNLTFIEGSNHIPFNIERAFWIYDVPGGEARGGHAYKTSDEVIIALSGSFDVIIDDGNEKQTFSLNRSYYGLYIPAGTWRHMENFSTNSLALIVASTKYDADDYIRDFNDFKNHILSNNKHIYPKINYEINPKSLENTTVLDCTIFDLKKIKNRAGNITPLEANVNLPYDIKRVFYLYDIPGGESRGAHSHKECHQFIIAASGSFEIVLDDGSNKRTVILNRPYQGLHIPPGIWAAEQGFSSGSICLVLASEIYDEGDYIRDYQKFIEFKKC